MNKLVELYKESSEEWSKKAGELEGVIKALEVKFTLPCFYFLFFIMYFGFLLLFMYAIMQTHLNQVEHDYKERLEMELSARNQFEKVDVILFQFAYI